MGLEAHQDFWIHFTPPWIDSISSQRIDQEFPLAFNPIRTRQAKLEITSEQVLNWIDLPVWLLMLPKIRMLRNVMVTIYWRPQHRRLRSSILSMSTINIDDPINSKVYYGIIIVVITIIIIMITPGDDSDNNEGMKIDKRWWVRRENIQLERQGLWSGLGFIMLRFL